MMAKGSGIGQGVCKMKKPPLDIVKQKYATTIAPEEHKIANNNQSLIDLSN